jgi:Na+/melibiose symporter-like transporter
VFIVYLLLSAAFYTANNIAYFSLPPLMTNDEENRVSLGSIRFIFANAAVLSIATFTTISFQCLEADNKAGHGRRIVLHRPAHDYRLVCERGTKGFVSCCFQSFV